MNEFKPQATVRSTRTIHISLIIGVLLFLLVTFSLVKEITPFQFNTENPLLVALVSLALAIIPASLLVPKMYLKNNPPTDELQSKLAGYQTILIIKSALWVGLAQFGILVFMLSGNPMAVSIAMVAIAVTASYYPSIESIRKTVNLSDEELQSLRK